MQNWRRVSLVAALGWATALAGIAQVVRPTISGTLKSASNGMVVVLSETGTVWRAKLEPGATCKWMGSNRSLSAIPAGSKVMLRVVGSLADKPLKVDLVTDWGSSSTYVATAAPAPYYTKKGDMAGPGGVGGKPDNGPTPGKDKNVGGYAVNGGMPHMNPQEIPNILAPRQQNAGVPQMAAGTPGFQQGPVPPAPAPGTGATAPAPGAFDPNQPPQPLNPAAAAAQYPGVEQPGMYPNMNPYNNVNPAMTPGMNPGMAPGMNPYMPGMNPGMNPYGPGGPAMNPGSNPNSLDSMLNSGDGEDGEMQSGGSMFPGYAMNQGSPVSLQATILRSDPATRSLVVQAVGSQVPQNVVLNPQVMLPPLREGQTVMIQGTSSPQGWIEAQSVTPYGQ